MSETKNAVDLVEPEMRILMQFITSNRDKLSEIYDMEHQTRGVGNPDNQGTVHIELYAHPGWARIQVKHQVLGTHKPNPKGGLIIECLR